MLPKQLLSLTGEQTMLQQTLERVRGFAKPITSSRTWTSSIRLLILAWKNPSTVAW
ncbi:hypothetical protein [Microbulbifer flavimaris]|uniref:hypothetical protein n=1 Tax=Microbulbifer TaxID=48073 RepID=UPI002FCCCF50